MRWRAKNDKFESISVHSQYNQMEQGLDQNWDLVGAWRVWMIQWESWTLVMDSILQLLSVGA